MALPLGNTVAERNPLDALAADVLALEPTAADVRLLDEPDDADVDWELVRLVASRKLQRIGERLTVPPFRRDSEHWDDWRERCRRQTQAGLQALYSAAALRRVEA